MPDLRGDGRHEHPLTAKHLQEIFRRCVPDTDDWPNSTYTLRVAACCRTKTDRTEEVGGYLDDIVTDVLLAQSDAFDGAAEGLQYLVG